MICGGWGGADNLGGRGGDGAWGGGWVEREFFFFCLIIIVFKFKYVMFTVLCNTLHFYTGVL